MRRGSAPLSFGAINWDQPFDRLGAIWKAEVWAVRAPREGLLSSWVSVGGFEAAPILVFLHHPADIKLGTTLHLLLGYPLSGNPQVTNYTNGSTDGKGPFLTKPLQKVGRAPGASWQLDFILKAVSPPAGCESKMKGCKINPLVRERELLPAAARHQRSSF